MNRLVHANCHPLVRSFFTHRDKKVEDGLSHGGKWMLVARCLIETLNSKAMTHPRKRRWRKEEKKKKNQKNERYQRPEIHPLCFCQLFALSLILPLLYLKLHGRLPVVSRDRPSGFLFAFFTCTPQRHCFFPFLFLFRLLVLLECPCFLRLSTPSYLHLPNLIPPPFTPRSVSARSGASPVLPSAFFPSFFPLFEKEGEQSSVPPFLPLPPDNTSLMSRQHSWSGDSRLPQNGLPLPPPSSGSPDLRLGDA